MNTLRNTALLIAVGLTALSVAAQSPIARRSPIIRHDPVTVALRGQPVTIRAVIATETGSVKTARLHYALSKDAAPFSVAMSSAGGGSYYATIAGTIIESASALTYYIEASDDADGSSETPWHTIRIQAPAQTVTPVTGNAAPPSEKQASWVKPALWAGGAALVAGGVVALSGGGGGGGGSGASATTNTGTYVGTVSTSLELQGSSPVSSSHPVSFVVVSDGIVSSDNLKEGQHLEARLSGRDFTMIAPVKSGGLSGEIRYYGSLLNDRILGSVSGSVSSNGTPGAYSGTFSATRQ